MKPRPDVRRYRVLGSLALLHALVAFLLVFLSFSSNIQILFQICVGVILLWFLWLIVLTLHRGRSVLGGLAFALLGLALLTPSLWAFNGALQGPERLGLPWGVGMNPISMWQYFDAYREGRANAKADLAAGSLVIEEAGFGAGAGPFVQIMRERYHIQVKGIAQCIVNQRILGHLAGYNSVSEPEIDRRIGLATVEAARKEGYDLARKPFRDLAKRMTGLSADSNIELHSVDEWANGAQETAPKAEQELRPIVQTIEKVVTAQVPTQATPFELDLFVRLEPTKSPEVSYAGGSGDIPSDLYPNIEKKLRDVVMPAWDGEPHLMLLAFKIRTPVRE